jgi:hypothetical protein
MASMSILDDAIREHLELKRAHGADEAEIKRLEDEAFGPPGRPEEPDPLAEAPTEFMATPGAEAATEDSGGRRINIADLQEPPEAPAPEAPPVPAEDPVQAAAPAEEESPAAEHDAIVDEPDAGHSTEERHAIAEQPTELFDVQSEIGDADAPPAEAPSPSDEEIAAVEAAEPKLAPVEPPTEIHASRAAAAPADDLAEEEDEDEDFWSDQRLSDELDQALEAPLAEEDEEPPAEASPTEVPISEEHEQPAATAEPEQQTNYDPDTGHEDVLEDTPDFLEDAPEDDELWFEQKPPKDFDFDD